MNRSATKAMLLASVLVAGSMGRAVAAANRAVDEANALYKAGKFEEALETYNRMAEERPESPELAFNRGAAQFQLGDFYSARQSFEQAGLMSERPEFQALSAYNLGNCMFKEGEQALQESPEAALDALNQSLRHYQDALARDRDLEPAAHNLELAKRTIRQIQEQIKQQQEQQQEQQEKQEEMKKELDELIEEQQQQNQQSEQAAEQQKDPARPDPAASEMEQMAEDQQQTREKTEALSEQMKPEEGQEGTPMDEARQRAEEAAEKQAEAEESLKNQDPEKGNEAQDEALEKLKQAREALDQNEEKPQEGEPNEQQADSSGDDSQQQPQSGDPSDEQQEPQPQPSEATDDVPPPDATARDILNQEQRNKEERTLRQMVRIRPVEKDW